MGYSKHLFVSLILLSAIAGCGGGGGEGGTTNTTNTTTLSWEAPTTNADGSPLTDPAGYKIYYGTASGTYSQNLDAGNIMTYTFNNLSSGTHYFAVTAYDPAGNESGYSNEVSKTIQ